LDPNFPADRLEYIIENSQSKTLIYEKGYTLNCNDEVAMVSLESILEGVNEYKGIVSENVSAKDTAYIIYTSGSTGNPKGVEIGHQSLVNFLTSIQSQPGFTQSDTMFSVTTYSFDISILEFFTPLISGSTLYVVSQEVLADPLLVIEKIEEIQPTIIQATPSFYQMLFNADWKGSQSLKVLCGGDLLSEALAEKLINHTNEVWNMYGPTETTIWSSMKKIEQPKDASNIGKPLHNTQFYILDEQLNPKPIGFTGAIYIAGDGLAKGYYKNESLTQERFIKNPFSDNSLLYETGDVGKWNTKGEIEFLGRNDFQVKVRGYRIELGDIENAILQYSETLKQVVVDAKDVNSEKVLVAYMVSASEVDKSDLRAFLQKKLPEYMIPGFYVIVDGLPLTSNGKVNRKALPSIVENDLIRREYEAPTNEVEQKLAEIWQDILNIDKIGITDNFFELGGTSLQIIKLHHRIELLWPRIMTVPDLFEFNSIRDIANYVYRNSEQETLEVEQEEMKFFEI
jgi:amino acid adenylation domain-containing protein